MADEYFNWINGGWHPTENPLDRSIEDVEESMAKAGYRQRFELGDSDDAGITLSAYSHSDGNHWMVTLWIDGMAESTVLLESAQQLFLFLKDFAPLAEAKWVTRIEP